MTVTLVCLPQEAGAHQREGRHRAHAREGPRGPGRGELARTSGKDHGEGPGRSESARLRPRRARDAGAAVPLARRARAARRRGEIARAVHVDHEHAAAAVSRAHSRHRRRRAARDSYTDPSVWASFDPEARSRSAAPIRRPSGRPRRRPTCCRCACPPTSRRRASSPMRIRRCCASSAADIEAARFEVDGEKIELPVKLKVHDSVFVPLAKWAMLLAGNYRCVKADGDGLHQGGRARRPRGHARGLQLGGGPVRLAGREPRRHGSLREIRQRGAVAGQPLVGGARARRRRAEHRARRSPGPVGRGAARPALGRRRRDRRPRRRLAGAQPPEGNST